MSFIYNSISFGFNVAMADCSMVFSLMSIVFFLQYSINADWVENATPNNNKINLYGCIYVGFRPSTQATNFFLHQ